MIKPVHYRVDIDFFEDFVKVFGDVNDEYYTDISKKYYTHIYPWDKIRKKQIIKYTYLIVGVRYKLWFISYPGSYIEEKYEIINFKDYIRVEKLKRIIEEDV